MKKIMITSLLSAFLLSACGYSVEQLANDEEKRREILKECAEMGMAAKDEEKCEIAAKAEIEAAKKGMDQMMNK